MQTFDDRLLKMRIERTDKTTEKDVREFYARIYRMAENLGFNVIAPQQNNQHLINRGEESNEVNR